MRSWLLPAAAVFLFCGSASAQTEATHGTAAPGTAAPAPGTAAGASTIDDDARYAWLDAEIQKIQGPTERWYTGWTMGYAWLAASQVAMAAAAPNYGLRVDSSVGAIVGALGFLSVAIQPTTMRDAQETLDQYDGTTALGKYERRRHAEYLIKSTAAEEAFNHSAIPFVLATIVNGVAAFVLIRSYNEHLAGWAEFGAGEAVTLIQMFSRPYSATHAWKHYEDDYHPVAQPSEVPPDQIDMIQKLHISLSVGPGGVGAVGAF